MNGHFATDRIQYVAIIGSFLLLVFIVELIRRKKLKEKYALLWICITIAFLFFSFWREGLDFFARLVGIAYAPAALFLIFLIGYLFILIHYSVIISSFSDSIKELAQKIALLEREVSKHQRKER